jgi:hypothetical protein
MSLTGDESSNASTSPPQTLPVQATTSSPPLYLNYAAQKCVLDSDGNQEVKKRKKNTEKKKQTDHDSGEDTKIFVSDVEDENLYPPLKWHNAMYIQKN